MATMNRLPQELLDTVIDHLHEDRNSLSSCSLVCSRWLAPARHHLFDPIRIAFGPCDTLESLDDLFDLLSPDSRVLPLTCRRAVLLIRKDRKQTHPWQRVLCALQSRLATFTSIKYYSADRSVIPSPLRGIIPPTITELDLKGVTFYHTADLIQFLATQPQLRRLSLDINVMNPDEDGFPGPEERLVFPRLQYLGMHFFCKYFLQWMSEHPFEVEELYVMNPIIDEFESFSTLLSSASQLQRLTILHPFWIPEMASQLFNVDLTLLSNLRFITLGFLRLSSANSSDGRTDLILTFISKLQPSVRMITLLFSGPVSQIPKFDMWTRLEELLAQLQKTDDGPAEWDIPKVELQFQTPTLDICNDVAQCQSQAETQARALLKEANQDCLSVVFRDMDEYEDLPCGWKDPFASVVGAKP